jgi:release factor glutamine methyltransferase
MLSEAKRQLEEQGIANPALDVRLLLQHVAGLTHADLVANPERQLSAAEAEAFRHMLDRRLRHEPVSRILGEREFFGRMFAIDESVLDPRPDTETLIEAALQAMPPSCRILDLGTGSGAIIITLLAERPDATGVAVDRSATAVATARRNAEKHGVLDRLQLIEGDWFQSVTGRFGLLVSNPPYIAAPDIKNLAPEVRDYDPHLALDGGHDGLDAYRAIAEGSEAHLECDARLLVEIGAGQEQAVIAIFRQSGLVYRQSRPDLGGHIRCLAFTKS